MGSEPFTFPITGPIRLVVRLGYGSITVAAKDGLADALVALAPRDPHSDVLDRVTVGMHDQTLVVTGPRQGGLSDLIGGWRRDRDRIDAVIEVPTGTPIRISSASEDITVTGTCGDLDIATSAGRLSVDTVSGDLRLRSGNANSRVGMVTGSAQLSAGGCTASIGEVGGSLDCKFGSGELSADVVRGDFHSRAGRASAHLGAVYGNVDLAFGSGPITIGIPAGVSAHLDVRSGVGQVVSDLPVEPVPAPARQKITVRARTGVGDIRLGSAAAA